MTLNPINNEISVYVTKADPVTYNNIGACQDQVQKVCKFKYDEKFTCFHQSELNYKNSLWLFGDKHSRFEHINQPFYDEPRVTYEQVAHRVKRLKNSRYCNHRISDEITDSDRDLYYKIFDTITFKFVTNIITKIITVHISGPFSSQELLEAYNYFCSCEATTYKVVSRTYKVSISLENPNICLNWFNYYYNVLGVTPTKYAITKEDRISLDGTETQYNKITLYSGKLPYYQVNFIRFGNLPLNLLEIEVVIYEVAKNKSVITQDYLLKHILHKKFGLFGCLALCYNMRTSLLIIRRILDDYNQKNLDFWEEWKNSKLSLYKFLTSYKTKQLSPYKVKQVLTKLQNSTLLDLKLSYLQIVYIGNYLHNIKLDMPKNTQDINIIRKLVGITPKRFQFVLRKGNK